MPKTRRNIYFLKCCRYIKIGFAESPWSRLADISHCSPHRMTMLGYMPGTFRQEQILQWRFRRYWKRGEWFRDNAELRQFIADHTTDRSRVKPTATYFVGKQAIKNMTGHKWPWFVQKL